MESIQRYWKRTDKTYLLLCILSSSFAVLALSSWAAKQGSGFALDDVTGQIVGVGDYRRAVVQAGAAAIGLCIAVLLSNIDYRSLVKVWPVHVAVTWGMVLPTLFIRNVTVGPLTIGYNAGDTDNYSWYKLGGFTLQPTELAKISFILTFAMHLNNVRGKINEPKELGKLLLHMLVPILIIHIQGDDGTAIIYGIIACCMMFSAGLSWKYIIGAISAAAAAVAVAFGFFSDKIGKGYQWYRILAVIDPENKTGWAPSETVWKNIIYQQQRGRSRWAPAASSATVFSAAAITASPTPTTISSSAGSATSPASWAAVWCWASCLRWSARPLPPAPAVRTCWAASSVPASAVLSWRRSPSMWA